MANLFKSFIKILYVVVFPILFIFISYQLITNYSIDTEMYAALGIIGIAVFANATMYLAFMSKIKMVPKITVEFVPIFGFAFGVDTDNRRTSVLLLLPFISFEIKVSKKREQ